MAPLSRLDAPVGAKFLRREEDKHDLSLLYFTRFIALSTRAWFEPPKTEQFPDHLKHGLVLGLVLKEDDADDLSGCRVLFMTNKQVWDVVEYEFGDGPFQQGFACFEYPSDAAVEDGLEYPYGYEYTPLDLEVNGSGSTEGVPAAAAKRASS